MKSVRYLYACGYSTRSALWSAAATTLLFAGCGEQAPSFTEQATLAPASEGQNGDVIASSDGDPSKADNNLPSKADNNLPRNATPGPATESTKANPYPSWKPGDPVGTEDTTNLTLVSDSAIQPSGSKVDILWVVDSSGSMSEEQSYLGANFSSFITQLTQTSTDFQIGVTSTDVCDTGSPSLFPSNLRYCPTVDGSSATRLKGSLVGSPGARVLTRNTPDLANRFVSNARVGTTGSSYEHGLTAMKMAIGKSVAGQNDGLVRSDAFLAVIVVSDEEDDGIGLGQTDLYNSRNFVDLGLTSYRYTSDDMVRDTLAVKGAGRFSVSTITGTKNANGTMCTSAHSQPKEAGTQYISAANKTGGIVQSICETNWSSSLALIGQDIAAQSSQIVLSQHPYPDTIKVLVDGHPTLGWSYNGGNNAVKFNSGSVPAAGSIIQIQYFQVP
jgi:hypothetical protein